MRTSKATSVKYGVGVLRDENVLGLKSAVNAVELAKLFADHIDPVVSPREGFQGWDVYISRLFTGALQPLCEACHKEKSKSEAKERQVARKARKNAPLA